MSETKKKISQSDYERLAGLLALARDLTREQDRIRRAAAEIVGDDPDDTGSHTADQVYSMDRPGPRALLRKLKIAVDPDIDKRVAAELVEACDLGIHAAMLSDAERGEIDDAVRRLREIRDGATGEATEGSGG